MGTEAVDEFDALFDEAVAAAEKKLPATDEPPADGKTGDDKGTQEAEKKAAEEAAEKKGEEKKGEEKKAEEEAAEEANEGKTPEQIAAEKKVAEEAAAKKAEEDKAAREAAEKKAEEEDTAREAAEKKAAEEAAEKKAEEARKKAEDLTRPYEPTEEEKKAMDTFAKEFPNEYMAVQAQLKSERKAMSGEIYKAVQEVLQQVSQVVTPLAQGFADEATEKHVKAIYEAHKDYDDVIDAIPAWVKKQPAYLRDAYGRVLKEGSTQEVIDLVARFKQETGRTAAPPPKKDEPKPGPTPEDIAAGLPVTSRRTGPSERASKNMQDFDGAFDEAAGK